MKKLFITLCGVVVLAGLSNFVYAKGCPCNAPKFTPEVKAKMEQKKAEFDKRLNLSSEQKDKMKAIHEASKAKIIPVFEKVKFEKAKLKQLKQSGASQQELQAQHAKVRTLREQIKTLRQEDFQQVQAILTADQQKEFNKMHEEHKKEFKKHRNEMKKKFSECKK